MPSLSRCLIAAFLVALAASLPAPAADRAASVTFDPNRSRIEWTLNGNVHEVHGTFRLKTGNLTYDTSSGKVRGEFVADADTGESGNSSRDKRMRSSILETRRFPEIRFVPENVSTPVGTETEFMTTVSGEFTLHGSIHRVSVPMSVKIINDEVTASGHFDIPYVQWGLKDPSTFLFRVNKDVQLHVTAVGRIVE